jgi:hypothetical protein
MTRTVFALGLAISLVTGALAQRIRIAAPGEFAQIHLLRNESVQKELKLGEAEVQKLRELFAENQESTREVWQKHPPEEAGPIWQDLAKQLRTDTLAVLTDAQRDRFRQIDFQQSRNFGFDSTTLQRTDVEQHLGFTAEQKQKLREIQAETLKKNQTATNPPNMYQQKIAAIRKEDREQVAALLTAEQKKQWDEMIGQPFVIVNVNPNANLQTALAKWIRDDFGRAQVESRKTGKPIFALFRCEP